MGWREDIIAAAESYLGVPYKGIYEGTGPDDGGFTCSGFVWRCYSDAGLEIPIAQGIHSYFTGSYNGWDTQAGWLINNGHLVTDPDSLQPGDIVLYSPVGDIHQTGHVAIYYGDGCVIHANGAPVSIDPLDAGGTFVGGGWPLEDLPDDEQPTLSMEVIPMTKETRIRFPGGVNVRAAPSLDAKIVSTYEPGSTCVIDGVVLCDGHCWGTYIGGSSGLRRFVALGTTELAEVI